MAVAVQDIIEGARSTHEAFAPEPHPTQACLAFLSRYHKTLVSRVTRLDPYRLALQHSINRAAWESGWDKGDTGEAALAHHVYLPGRANYDSSNDGWDILQIAAWQTRNRYYRSVNDSFWPAYSIVAGNVFLHGEKMDWARYESVDLFYVPMTASLSLLDDIALPDSAEPAIIAALAYHLCQRSANQPGAPNCLLLRQDWMEAEKTFLDEVAAHQAHHSSATLDVW